MKKQKLLWLLGLLVGSMTLSGCFFNFDFNGGGSDSGNGGGSSGDNGQTGQDVDDSTFEIEKDAVTGKTSMKVTYKDYGKRAIYNNLDYAPSSGDVKLLIIPIWFTNSSSFISEDKKETVRDDIRKAYLGTNEETGWRSVKTFYEEESSNKVQIDGTVSEWRSVSYSAEEAGLDDSITYSLVTDSANWFFSTHPEYSPTDFDSDKNGYMDGVMLIYGAPDTSAWSTQNRMADSYENLWAYCAWLENDIQYGTSIPNVFFWASYDFMYSNGAYAKMRTDLSVFGSGDTSHCAVDAHTYIHEMGHVFGLDDYYDYGDNKYKPAAGFSMQDYNVGSHDPYSVMALGWADPFVVTDNSEVTIGTFQKTRDVILLTSNFNQTYSPFDEYLLIELYSPTGLNEFDCSYPYQAGYKRNGPSETGLRIWHVDARLAYCNRVKDGGAVFSDKQITSDINQGSVGVYHAFSNSFDNADYGSCLGERYYNYNLLQLIRNNKRESYRSKTLISNNDLFTSGNYSLSTYYNQFVKTTTLNNGSYLKWNIKVEINGSGNDATAKITIVK